MRTAFIDAVPPNGARVLVWFVTKIGGLPPSPVAGDWYDNELECFPDCYPNEGVFWPDGGLPVSQRWCATWYPLVTVIDREVRE